MLTICLCRSSGAYEALRDSGCLSLPSQRTLRDYTHYVKASCGFSAQVDIMLREASKVDTCPEREKCTILLLDEMYIREDLVYDKYNGELVGFTNLGCVNEHLVKYEQSLLQDGVQGPKVAKTMAMFMVRGLFNSLQFPYAQFPSNDLCGDQLYDPLWEAIWRIENCGIVVFFHICTCIYTCLSRCLE